MHLVSSYKCEPASEDLRGMSFYHEKSWNALLR